MMNYPKVKILRASKREGLIRARLLGAAVAKAPVLTYLDSHCECTEGWLEPLLDRIAQNQTTVVCPVIDVIDDTTLEYHWRDSGGVNVGGFDWNLQVCLTVLLDYRGEMCEVDCATLSFREWMFSSISEEFLVFFEALNDNISYPTGRSVLNTSCAKEEGFSLTMPVYARI